MPRIGASITILSTDKESMENRYPFSIATAAIRILRLDSVKTQRAKLKLILAEGGPVYILRGRYDSFAAADSVVSSDTPTFVIGTDGTSDVEMSLESDMGTVTVLNRGANRAIGTIQLVDCP